MTSPLIILGWSTRNLPSAQVVDYAVHAIGAGLEPMSVEIPDPAGFDVLCNAWSLGTWSSRAVPVRVACPT